MNDTPTAVDVNASAQPAAWELLFFELSSSLPGVGPFPMSEVFPLSQTHPNVIGRVRDATIVIPDRRIARNHFRLVWDVSAQAFLLSNDPNVRTPTSVNGRLLGHDEICPVHAGDEILVGLARLRLQHRPGAAAGSSA